MRGSIQILVSAQKMEEDSPFYVRIKDDMKSMIQ